MNLKKNLQIKQINGQRKVNKIMMIKSKLLKKLDGI